MLRMALLLYDGHGMQGAGLFGYLDSFIWIRDLGK